MATVPRSYAKSNGEQFEGAQSCGRVCELDQGGIQASEKFLSYDEQENTCTIRIGFGIFVGQIVVELKYYL